ncbi:ABC transporter permease [Rhodoferax saidenbachensis]|uniref:Osmoprotectant uptake system permease n=1 Tax=Rhodoferax saidenbachensis TaxID=1484693 RepID=A0A1P8K5A1_9BURK|nr:ABC transporter permease [Rhodoferax saidenbachensis]APW41178.1 osmoprotectant uptake system permease [Rhodoferax saidenbachensis]
MKHWRSAYAVPLLLAALLVALSLGLPALEPLFHAVFPQQERPMYQQAPFWSLLWAHVQMVLVSSTAAFAVAFAAGTWVTRARGLAFRPALESLVSMGQTFPPIAVLALAVPLMGFGEKPVLLALALYGLLPMLQGVLAGFALTPAATLDAARGLGLNARQIFWQVELPLAAPIILAGVRSSVTINIGTAAIASTVGAQNLGAPIIIGLSGFNTAYVLQGAVLTGLLAITVDSFFERLGRQLQRG